MTPSAPMAGISRSVVLSPDETIRLELRPGSPLPQSPSRWTGW
ncbi:hypothetical protein OG470_17690 [Micromonospora sp. NBC_00389]